MKFFYLWLLYPENIVSLHIGGPRLVKEYPSIQLKDSFVTHRKTPLVRDFQLLRGFLALAHQTSTLYPLLYEQIRGGSRLEKKALGLYYGLPVVGWVLYYPNSTDKSRNCMFLFQAELMICFLTEAPPMGLILLRLSPSSYQQRR